MIPNLWLRFVAFFALYFWIAGLPLTSLARPSYDVQWSVSVANDGCVAPTAIGYDVDDVLTAREENNSTLGERLLLPQFTEFLAAKTAPEATGFLGSKGFELGNAVRAGEQVVIQDVRNAPAIINGRNFSGHALDQMQNRGIMPSVVENTLNVGQSFPTRAGTAGFYDSVNGVRVIVNSQNGTVVTVIRGAP